MQRTVKAVLAALLVATAMPSHGAARVDGKAIADERQGANWLAYGRTYSEQRFSPLAKIKDSNVKDLGLAWHLDLPEDRSLLSTPLVVDGVLYFSGSFSVVTAVDATSGKVLWRYDPKVIEHSGDRLRIFWDFSRGIAFWKGRVYAATVDGRLIAIDAKTGQEVWSTMTVDPNQPYYITGAPRVFRDKVVIGNGGTELGAIRGYVTAYDTETGKQVWRFYTVPGNPADGFEDETQAMAAKTWNGEWWKHGGGGTAWNAITYDSEFNRVYIGTGNGSPWNQRMRSPGGGDNLFLCAIVALDADTGKYMWHYQTTPGESWDYNSAMDIMLADLKLGGRNVKALLHAPKNGFFYIIDRANGKLLSAEPFAKVTWASKIDLATGKPIENPGQRYESGEAIVWPSPFGAHSWHAMSYNPKTGLVYIPSIEMAGLFSDKGMEPATWHSPKFQFDPAVDLMRDDVPANAGNSALMAWDPVHQRQVWRQPLPGVWNPGTLSTAGNLVFQGRVDGEFVAYRADTGAPVWRFPVGVGISAPPISYAVKGKQYVALLAGWGGAGASMPGSLAAQHGWTYRGHPRRLLAFSLDGKETLPPGPPPAFAVPLDAPGFEVQPALAERGGHVFVQQCVMCHGAGAVSGGYAPDLRASAIPIDPTSFRDVLLKGVLRSRGMPAFNDLSADEIEALQHYIRQQAKVTAKH